MSTAEFDANNNLVRVEFHPPVPESQTVSAEQFRRALAELTRQVEDLNKRSGRSQ